MPTYTINTPLGEMYFVPKKVSKKKKILFIQKCLGLILIVCGVIFCAVFPEDCGGGLFELMLGAYCVFTNKRFLVR